MVEGRVHRKQTNVPNLTGYPSRRSNLPYHHEHGAGRNGIVNKKAVPKMERTKSKLHPICG
jgi:hypothetical protein